MHFHMGLPLSRWVRSFSKILTLALTLTLTLTLIDSLKVSKSKSGTGRVVVARELGVLNCYTLEATFAG